MCRREIPLACIGQTICNALVFETDDETLGDDAWEENKVVAMCGVKIMMKGPRSAINDGRAQRVHVLALVVTAVRAAVAIVAAAPLDQSSSG